MKLPSGRYRAQVRIVPLLACVVCGRQIPHEQPAAPVTGALYVGIDPASSRAGLATIDQTAALRTTALHARGEVPDRLVQLRRQTRQWLTPAAEQGAWCCVVERPSTRHGGATLLAAYGVLVEAAKSILDCPVLTLTPAQIDQAVNRTERGDRKTWTTVTAACAGYLGASQDVSDAVVCALAARALTERAYPTVEAA